MIRSVFALFGLFAYGVLGAWILPPPKLCYGEPNARKLERDLRTLVAALEEYAAEHQGRLPESLEALPDRPPLDPWGNRYAYDPRRRVVRSLGSDGALGGEGTDADVDSRPIGGRR